MFSNSKMLIYSLPQVVIKKLNLFIPMNIRLSSSKCLEIGCSHKYNWRLPHRVKTIPTLNLQSTPGPGFACSNIHLFRKKKEFAFPKKQYKITRKNHSTSEFSQRKVYGWILMKEGYFHSNWPFPKQCSTFLQDRLREMAHMH